MYTTTPQTSHHDARANADAAAIDAPAATDAAAADADEMADDTPCSSLLDFLYDTDDDNDGYGAAVVDGTAEGDSDADTQSSTQSRKFVPKDLDDALEWYMSWAHERGIDLWDHQIDALLSIASGNHVILGTPTGSGKSMVAIGMAFFCLCQDRVMYYTAPIKALVSEKFFNLVDLFGKDLVGMITGDVVINSSAPIICCTEEILAMDALRWGTDSDISYVCMDEFHYFGDSARGWAWQVPLLTLPNTQFLLMSATLGDTSAIQAQLERDTARSCDCISHAKRPVELVYSYVTSPLDVTVIQALHEHKAPMYIVHFAQDQAHKSAQALSCLSVITPEQKAAIKQQISHVRFTTAFGVTLKRLLLCGVGIHHAGMLPRYRLCVERLSQKGLLPVICGTDTLGVGINVPIHTVIFSALAKFDGRRARLLRAREFHQIAGRAGRAGFDSEGVVYALATPYEIERLKAQAKAAGDPRKLRRIKLPTPPEGYVSWNKKTFETLITKEPEVLHAHLKITHAFILSQMEQQGDAYQRIVDIIMRSLQTDEQKQKLIARAQEIIATLIDGGVIERIPDDPGDVWGKAQYQCSVEMPEDFALDQPLSPFVLAALELLDKNDPQYALDVVSLVESSLDNPVQIMKMLERQARDRAWAEMKMQGVDYEERMERIEEVTYDQPLCDLISSAYERYCEKVPWARDFLPHPKSIVRLMVESGANFKGFVQQINVSRSEGLLLRYLSDAWRVLERTIPDDAKTEELEAITSWLHLIVRTTDSSLIDEWDGTLTNETDEKAPSVHESIVQDRRGLQILIHNALFARVRAAAARDIDALNALDGAWGWYGRVWQAFLDTYYQEHEYILLDANARSNAYIVFDESEEETRHCWHVRQILKDEDDDCDFAIVADVDIVATQQTGELTCTAYRACSIDELVG